MSVCLLGVFFFGTAPDLMMTDGEQWIDCIAENPVLSTLVTNPPARLFYLQPQKFLWTIGQSEQNPCVKWRIGMLIFMVTEAMFFAALISAYLVIRAGLEEWPPWGQPRLPGLNTA
ncbi:MAG: hypothetical protein Ct9H300mP21_05540 [Pseudomonadota bacterium]|nr:MAG: hypothetical protein Ct9H300mP21_05540 [Pseudomonadota bacterium]